MATTEATLRLCLTRRCSRPGFALLDARLGGRRLSGRSVRHAEGAACT